MHKLCLVAIDIRSAHNIGSLFRSCDGFKSDLVLTGITPRPLGAKNDNRLPHITQKAHKEIEKTALGATNTVNWTYFASAVVALEHLKKQGYLLIAVEQTEKSLPIYKLQLTQPTALIVGPEVTGLTKNIIEMCESVYEIPMIGAKESFNVSVAAAIALYQARYQEYMLQ